MNAHPANSMETAMTRSALFALAAAVVLASAGLSSTNAFAAPRNPTTGNSVHVGQTVPGCSRIGCNMKQ
jgi:hypothetical protein